jgi:hypothetical protein
VESPSIPLVLDLEEEWGILLAGAEEEVVHPLAAVEEVGDLVVAINGKGDSV